jgi:nicotinamidase-related amidase
MIERSRLALVVIDYQEKLLPHIFNADAILAQALKLIEFAKALSIPVLCTEQYPKGLGHSVPAISDALADVDAMDKTSFGCMGDATFVQNLKRLQRDQLLVTGIETHVCVMQTVLAAQTAGYQTFVPRDAVGSRAQSEYDAGLDRMQRAGSELVTTEMAMFETLREAGTPEFKRVLPLIK